MKKFYMMLFVLLNILFTQRLVAQLKDNYIKSVITLKNGQNVNAYIKQQGLEKIRSGVFYKMSLEDSKDSVYAQNQIDQVLMETGEVFKTLDCVVSKSSDTISVLASLLLKGEASLYETSYHQNHIYIVVNRGECFWLQDNEIVNGELVNYRYKNVLSYALKNSAIKEEDIERISFNDKDLIKLISKYNLSSNSVNELIKAKNNTTSYIIAGIGGMYKDAIDSRYYIQAIYRNYFPWISNNTSLNIGLSYFRDISKTDIGNYSDITAIRNLYSVPFYMQQNLLNKRIRPYLFGGINISYIKEEIKDDQVIFIKEEGLQQNYGVGLLFGGGIEADVLKNFIVKTEYRFENFPQALMVGVAYKFQLR